jgi:hypothetical protein
MALNSLHFEGASVVRAVFGSIVVVWRRRLARIVVQIAGDMTQIPMMMSHQCTRLIHSTLARLSSAPPSHSIRSSSVIAGRKHRILDFNKDQYRYQYRNCRSLRSNMVRRCLSLKSRLNLNPNPNRKLLLEPNGRELVAFPFGAAGVYDIVLCAYTLSRPFGLSCLFLVLTMFCFC